MSYFLQAIVIVGFPHNVRLVEGLVGVHTVHGGFDSRILQHMLCPLFQLRCTVKATEKTKGIKSFTKDQITTHIRYHEGKMTKKS